MPAAHLARFVVRLLAAVTLSLALAVSAHASDYGCRVALCMSNPNGPEAVQECVAPIEQLKQDLQNGRPFPQCEESNGAVVLALSNNPYNDCPSGTSALGVGQLAYGAASDSSLFTGIGDGSDASLAGSNADSGTQPPNKVCVGQSVGTAPATVNNGDSEVTLSVAVYNTVVSLSPSSSIGRVNVYINSVLTRSVGL